MTGARGLLSRSMAVACLAASAPAMAFAQPVTSPGGAHSHNSAATPALDPQVAGLLEITRRSTEPFRDRGAAILAGYRRIGPDVPSMGEHWISPRIVVADSFDVAHPALLTYIKVDGKPVLTGVVYAVPLAVGQAPPQMFGPDALWHEHNGTLDEEALLPDHHTKPSEAKSTRLAILHAWLWSPNPGGIFATENWTIPFLRLGLHPPEKFPEGAARALSLLSGSEAHFAGIAGSRDAQVLTPLLRECATRAAATLAEARKKGDGLTDSHVTELDMLWTATMSAVAAVSGREVAARLNGR
jgi:hypothetical protein